MKPPLASSLLWVFLTGPGLACYPDPNFAYDDIRSADISIVIATVSAVEIETRAGFFEYFQQEKIWRGGATCWVIRYDSAEYLYGAGPRAFSVTTCTEGLFQVDAMLREAEGAPYLGFIPAAEVLLGIVQQDTEADAIRYAVPSCWGPLHYNLDIASEEERADLLAAVRDQMERER
jgi:hypothetical protein